MAIPFSAEMQYEYNWLYEYVCDHNHYFTSALMGNLYAESHCYPVCLQPNHYNDQVAIDYTNDVDNFTTTRAGFISDQTGYGLAQWTIYTRKTDLYDYWYSHRYSYPSIGNLQLQLFFIRKEFTENPRAYKYDVLKQTYSVDSCSDIICDYYENPLVHNYQARRNYSHEFYDEYADQPVGQYRVYVYSDNAGGTVYASTAYANAGDTVWLYHTEVAGVTFQNFTSNDVTIVDNSFTMPASDVTIYGHFTGSPTPTQGYPINIVTNKRSWIQCPATADVGDVVHIGFSPFAKQKIILIESADVTLSETFDGYSFYMPPNAVTIRIKFKLHKSLLVAKNPQLLYQERRNSLW